MSSELRTALAATLAPHFAVSKSRLFTLVIMIIGLANTRTVNLSHLASQFPGAAMHASNYRRLQRFFQFEQLDQDRVAQIVVGMLNLSRPKYLALDRTNWKLGSKNINILMLAIVTRRFRIPLMWTLLDHQGNSNTRQRIALMQRYLALFGANSIGLLLADREFIGRRWMDFLNENNIPFAIRVKKGLRFTLANGGTWKIKTLLRNKRFRKATLTWEGRLPNSGTPLQLAAKQIKSGEWLVIMTNAKDPKKALCDYKKRWGIECLFGDTKTRGLNMEDTRLVSLEKLATLLCIVTLSLTWAYRCASRVMGMKAIRRKTHGRREKSWFRIGFDALRKWILYQPDEAICAWTAKCPKRFNS